MSATDAVLSNSESSVVEAPARDRRRGGEISLFRLTLYALPSVPIAFLYLPVTVMMPAYYASTLHVGLSAIGAYLLVSRSLDFILDPMIGKWSDGTRSSLGRRKIWMLLGTPVLMLGAYLLFSPPLSPSGEYLLMASFIVYAGGSLVGLPYSAWGTELVQSYHARSRLAGFREGAGVIGGLMAASIPAITSFYGHGVDRFTMSIMGFAIVLLTPLTVLIAATSVPEAAPLQRQRVDWRSALLELLRNGPFRILCGAYVLFSIGASVANATMIFYMSDYLGRPKIVGLVILSLAVTTVTAVPAWLWVSRKVGKHAAIAYSLFLTIGIFSIAGPWLQPGQGLQFVVLMCGLGLVSAGYVTLPLSIIGDVIDYDLLKHRTPRGGLYWGVWSFSQKITPALGIAVTLWLLKLLEFNPGGHNTPQALDALRYVFCLGPAPCMLLGGMVLLQFPIDARRHGVIRRRIEARERRAMASGR